MMNENYQGLGKWVGVLDAIGKSQASLLGSSSRDLRMAAVN